MGNESSKPRGPPPPLPPAPVPIGLIRELCHPYEVTLNVKEQVGWSGDSFEIRDVNGQPAFIMQGRAMSFRQKKVLKDLSGNPIVNFKHEFSMFKKYCIYAGGSSGRVLATIRPHVFLGITADIEFTNHDGTQRLFGLDGDFLSSEAIITDRSTRMPVGRISRRRWNTNDIIFGQQTYFVTAAPNVDLSLIICICVALDEAKNDK